MREDTGQGGFRSPRYWPVWLGIALLWLITRMPWRMQMRIGSLLGLITYALLGFRRRISCINLAIAFPELTPQQRRGLNRKHFISLGQGLIEAALSWWGNDQVISKLTHIEGREYLDQALASGKGILLLSAHFTSLELGGRMLVQSDISKPLHVVYRPHQNALIESLVAKLRARRYGKAIARDRIRAMVSSLKQGFPVWYAQDQSYSGKNSVLVNFFGHEAATNSATSRLAGMTGAVVVPYFTFRLRGERNGYLLRFLAPLDNFPSEDVEQDTLRINQLIERQVREFPDQYLWTHKRYKQKGGEFHRQDFYRQDFYRQDFYRQDFYRQYVRQNPELDCQ